MTFQCTAKNTFDYHERFSSGKDIALSTSSCINGTTPEVLLEIRQGFAKSRSCFTNDSVAYCAQGLTALAQSAQMTEPFAKTAAELSQKTGKTIKPASLMLLLVNHFDQFDKGTSTLTLPIDGYDITFTAQDALYAQLAYSTFKKDASAASAAIPNASKDCFDKTKAVPAHVCRDLGKVIAGRALQGKETTINDVAPPRSSSAAEPEQSFVRAGAGRW